jgi:hypothetical protein
MRQPKTRTSAQLDKYGIALLSHSPMVLQCQGCGVEWRLIRLPRVRLPRKYWACLNGCNANQE